MKHDAYLNTGHAFDSDDEDLRQTRKVDVVHNMQSNSEDIWSAVRVKYTIFSIVFRNE